MDFIKKILELFQKDINLEHEGLVNFISSSSESKERIVTCYPTETGMLVFCSFDPEQWSIVNDLAKIRQQEIPDLIEELAEQQEIPTLLIDPTEFY